MNSFLENFAGRDKAVPKLALYRLWLGSSVETMKCLTCAHGDGKWGKLHDTYFLAEGDAEQLKAVFSKLENKYGLPIMGEKGKKLEPISDIPLDKKMIVALKELPQAKATASK